MNKLAIKPENQTCLPSLRQHISGTRFCPINNKDNEYMCIEGYDSVQKYSIVN